MSGNATFTVSIQLPLEEPHIYQFDDVGMARFLIDWQLTGQAQDLDRLMVRRSMTMFPPGQAVVTVRRVNIWN